MSKLSKNKNKAYSKLVTKLEVDAKYKFLVIKLPNKSITLCRSTYSAATKYDEYKTSDKDENAPKITNKLVSYLNDSDIEIFNVHVDYTKHIAWSRKFETTSSTASQLFRSKYKSMNFDSIDSML